MEADIFRDAFCDAAPDIVNDPRYSTLFLYLGFDSATVARESPIGAERQFEKTMDPQPQKGGGISLIDQINSKIQ